MPAKEPPKNDFPQSDRPQDLERRDAEEKASDIKQWEDFDRAVERLSRKPRPKPPKEEGA